MIEPEMPSFKVFLAAKFIKPDGNRIVQVQRIQSRVLGDQQRLANAEKTGIKTRRLISKYQRPRAGFVRRLQELVRLEHERVQTMLGEAGLIGRKIGEEFDSKVK